MKIYILGICGTFMAGVAQLATELNFEVEGSDAKVYPPMSTQLEQAGITLHDGYHASSLPDDCDMFIIGNAISRGNEQFETILDKGLPYISGPQWLYEQVLRDRWVLAVAGTHGKTTTSSMLTWILEYAGLKPGYLIGGISQNFTNSSRLGDHPFFVIEADEYDSALFDKRSKFVHYHPRTLILNNLEFDHGDIFDDLDAIKRQFHHLVRTLPSSGLIIHNGAEQNLQDVLDMGCWSETISFSNDCEASADFVLTPKNELLNKANAKVYALALPIFGQFNALNATAAILGARHAGVSIDVSIEALKQFDGVKRRQEIIAEINGVRIIDDFAHHPTAIKLTLAALAEQTSGRLIGVVDLASNTMKMGSLVEQLGKSFEDADQILLHNQSDLHWDIDEIVNSSSTEVLVKPGTEQIIDYLCANCRQGDQVVIMSNGGFDNIHRRLIDSMQSH